MLYDLKVICPLFIPPIILNFSLFEEELSFPFLDSPCRRVAGGVICTSPVPPAKDRDDVQHGAGRSAIKELPRTARPSGAKKKPAK
jgi:hypothetical protein